VLAACSHRPPRAAIACLGKISQLNRSNLFEVLTMKRPVPTMSIDLHKVRHRRTRHRSSLARGPSSAAHHAARDCKDAGEAAAPATRSI
jgi:hypothetical protein